ncbi:MAG TPA: hypothetical protein VFE09_09680 [Rubrobacteraceae bacterium]|nr:hypothetical protein [Rubrobacteraceae bacterium]
MPSSNLVRWGAIGAMLAGVAWIASVVVNLAITSPQGPTAFSLSSPLDEATYIVALAGMLVGLAGLHARQTRSYGRLGVTGFLVAFMGSALALLGLVLSLSARGEVFERELLDQVLGLGLLAMLLGLVLLGLGFIVLGIATLRAGVLPRWCGVALILALPVSVALGNYGGRILLGVVWLALGYVLWAKRGEAAQRSRRAT